MQMPKYRTVYNSILSHPNFANPDPMLLTVFGEIIQFEYVILPYLPRTATKSFLGDSYFSGDDRLSCSTVFISTRTPRNMV